MRSARSHIRLDRRRDASQAAAQRGRREKRELPPRIREGREDPSESRGIRSSNGEAVKIHAEDSHARYRRTVTAARRGALGKGRPNKGGTYENSAPEESRSSARIGLSIASDGEKVAPSLSARGIGGREKSQILRSASDKIENRFDRSSGTYFSGIPAGEEEGWREIHREVSTRLERSLEAANGGS